MPESIIILEKLKKIKRYRIKEIRTLSILFLSLFILPETFSQNNISTIIGDERDLYSQTKQVNQFFRRFNNEEDRFGNRYYPGDSLYRDKAFRQVYLNMLFDKEGFFIDEELKVEFSEIITNPEEPFFLDFHGGQWFAELAATFQYHKSKENLILFLQLEQENLGYKWVLTNVYFDKFLKQFYKGDEDIVRKSFLHPMSHELDFMNMHKVFDDDKYIEYFAQKSFKPDYLSILLFETKRGDMEFLSSGDLKFHFFQVEGWYFELSFFNRPGYNSGWLISKLFKITQEEKDELIKFYLP